MRSATSLRLASLAALPLAASIGGTALAQPAQAPGAAPADNELAIWAGYGDSDNIGRSANPENGTYRSVGLYAGLQRETSRLEGGINSDLEYREYTDDVLENETIGDLTAYALVDIVADRFMWNFDGSMSQGQLDPFAPRGPNNRETIKVFTTGPQLDIPFGRTSLGVRAMRSTRRYDESAQVDNDNDFYEIELSRQARPTTAFALVASSSETEYVDALVSPYQIDQLFVRVEKDLRNGTLSADVGTNEISSGPQSRRDPLLDLIWTRMLGTRSTFGISASQEFTDSGTYHGATGDVLVTSDPYELKSVDMTYGLSLDRVTARMNIGVGKEDYAGGSTFDNDYQSAAAGLDYRLSTRVSVGLSYELYEREFGTGAGTPEHQDDRNVGVWLNWTLGRRFSVAVDRSRYEATGFADIEENRTEIRFSYSPTGSTSAGLGSIGR